MLWRAASRRAKDQTGLFEGGVMTAEQVEHAFALAIGFAIAGCWSVMSGAIVVMGLRAFGVPVG
jgi:hypothetical protein